MANSFLSKWALQKARLHPVFFLSPLFPLSFFKWTLGGVSVAWLALNGCCQFGYVHQRGSNIPKELKFRAFMVLTLSCPVLPHLPFNSSHVSILQGLPDLCTSSKLLVIPYKVLMSTFRVLSLFPETWTLTVHCCQKSHQNLSINVPELAHGAQKLFIQ